MIRIEYFDDATTDDQPLTFAPDLAEGETILNVERCLDGGYNTSTYRVYILTP